MSMVGNQQASKVLTSADIADGAITPQKIANSVGKGGGNDSVFVLNSQTINTDYTLPTGYNAQSGGPITVNAIVTIPDGAGWAIL